MKISHGKIIYLDNNQKKIRIDFNINEAYENNQLIITPELTKLKTGEKLTVNLEPKNEITIKELTIECKNNFNQNDKIFLNGYQSWSETKEFDVNEKINKFNNILTPIFNFYKIKNFGDASFYKYTGKHGDLHGYTYTYIKKADDFYLIGSLSEEFGYTIYKYSTNNNKLHIINDSENVTINQKYKVFDLVFLHGSEEVVFDEYFKHMNIQDNKNKMLTGWTSWYNYYTGITEDIILENLNNFKNKKIPIDVFQIDDGYQTAVGDWLSIKKEFPNGMKYIADKIKQEGYKAGIWCAPFICQKKSKVFKEHPDWILTDIKGKPARLGYSAGYWDDHFYVIDFYNKEAQKYISHFLNTMLYDWGFDMIKLDFLYSISLYHRTDKPRSLLMTEVVNFLQDITKNKITLGCGVPLGPTFGKFDYCRIGSDVALTWENEFYKSLNYRERVSTINSLLSTIHLRHLNGKVFYNDPDVFILRDENNDLTEIQKYTLFLLNQIFGGLIFTSDNIGNYSDKTMELYLSQFPVKENKFNYVHKNNLFYDISFKIDNLEYKIYANLDKVPQKVELNKGIYFSSKDKKFYSESNFMIEPYESLCFLQINENDEIAIAGSEGHIFPGSEIENFIVSGEEVTFNFHSKTGNKRNIFIKIPDSKEGMNVNGKFIKAVKKFNMNVLKVETA